MKQKLFWPALSCYLKQKLRYLCLMAACGLLFAAVFSLYRLQVEAVLYACALCAALLLVCGAVDFYRYYHRHLALVSLLAQLPYGTEQLPVSRDLISRDYQALIGRLHHLLLQAETRAASERQEQVDYYSLWVHQIKTPIAAMHLLLQAQPDTPATKALAAELFKIEQYAELVLSYLRLGRDASDYLLTTCSLKDLVHQAVRKYAPLFIRQKLSLQLGALDISVLTDEKWLVLVIEQLLSNAVKYTPSGQISIAVQNGDELVIADTGIGIDPADLPRICEKGYTGHSGRLYKRSTGLGLYLCRRILDSLGHTMRIESSPGAGTRVILGLGRPPLEVE